MAKLVLSMDGLVLKEIPLTKERTTIGRKPHNDIQIDNLAISGDHAAIVTILKDSFLEDLNSTNGTYVNGQPIKKHVLQTSDVIELGKYRLKFLNEPVTKDAATDYEKTVILRPEDLAGAAGSGGAKQAGGENVPGPHRWYRGAIGGYERVGFPHDSAGGHGHNARRQTGTCRRYPDTQWCECGAPA